MIATGAQVLDRGEIRRRLDVFVHDWTANIDSWDAGERSRSEKSNAQRFWEGQSGPSGSGVHSWGSPVMR